MPTFPVLTTGAVTQYPSSRRTTYSTSVTRFVDGKEQRFRELQAPLRSWVVRLNQLSAQEIGELEIFFNDQQGQFGSFTFIDPWDETEYVNCSFEQNSFSMDAVDENRYEGYLEIRNNTP